MLQAVQPVGHGARGQQQGVDQLLRIHGVRRARAVKRGQHIEFTLVQVVVAKAAVHVAGGEGVHTEHAGDDRHGGKVLRGTFRAPLRDHQIDQIRGRHGSNTLI
ncbi:hypothetical protein D3C73_1394400 [compost metagenome]